MTITNGQHVGNLEMEGHPKNGMWEDNTAFSPLTRARATGTPPGVGHGQKPPVYLRAGNEVRLGVEGLGEQRQRVVADR